VKTLKVAICVDPMGCGQTTAEEEVEQHKVEIRDRLKPRKLKFYQIWNVEEVKPGTDLLLFDYGGMMPGNSLSEDNSRALIQWCRDNPNSLALVMTKSTYDWQVEIELRELGPAEQPHNLINYRDVPSVVNDGQIPNWFLEMHQ